MGNDQVTNISTALMSINELSSCCDIPINIHFDAKGRIYVHVGFGTLYRREASFYPQDTYRSHSETDDIYKWIEGITETLAVKKTNPVSLSGRLTETAVIGAFKVMLERIENGEIPLSAIIPIESEKE